MRDLNTVFCHQHSHSQPRYPHFTLCPYCREDAPHEAIVVEASEPNKPLLGAWCHSRILLCFATFIADIPHHGVLRSTSSAGHLHLWVATSL